MHLPEDGARHGLVVAMATADGMQEPGFRGALDALADPPLAELREAREEHLLLQMRP